MKATRKSGGLLGLLGLLVIVAIFGIFGGMGLQLAWERTLSPPVQMDALAISDSRTWAGDPFLDIARGRVDGFRGEQKFGRATDIDGGVLTDIHDGANATTARILVVVPTVARTHVITSTSANDTAAGTGARTITIFGLVDWDTPESTETLTLLGAFSVTTTFSYVDIHRMVVTTSGTSGPNDGIIAATALVDDTVSAQINAGQGQTQMAFLCFPSVQTFYITRYYASFLKGSGATGTVNIALLVNSTPDSEPSNWVVKHTQSAISTGSTLFSHPFEPYFKIDGPGCAKMQGDGSVDNIDASAGFNGILVDD